MAELRHAYSVLTVKAFNDDQRTFDGVATTPSADRMGDIVEPDGAIFKLPLPLLWQHDSSKPIGLVDKAKVTKDGISVSGHLVKIDEPGTLKDRLDEAWQSIKLQLVRGLSIGFNPLETAQIKDTWSYRYLSWEWLELSAVTIPANADASITAIKSADLSFLRARKGASRPRPVIRAKSSSPVASGPKHPAEAGFFIPE